MLVKVKFVEDFLGVTERSWLIVVTRRAEKSRLCQCSVEPREDTGSFWLVPVEKEEEK